MEFVNKLYRNIYYFTHLRNLEKQNALKNHIDKKSTIAIFSSPRGGSTWVAELLNKAINNSSLILEPLYRGVYQSNGIMPTEHKAGLPTDKLGYWYYQPIGEKEVWPESSDFFKKLLNRELLSLSITYENKFTEIPGSDKFIFKFCYGHLLMPWLFNQFDFTGIFLIRHPGAVIASQLNHINWGHIRSQKQYKFLLPKFRNSDFFDPYSDILKQIETPEENLAAMWAISNQYVINHPYNNVKWKTISYEELYLNPKETLQELSEYIGVPFSDDVINAVRNPSKTTGHKTSIHTNQLSSWRNQFSEEQVSRISRILSLFNVDYYSMDHDMPRHDIIKSMVRP